MNKPPESAWYFEIEFFDGTKVRVDNIPVCSRCGHTPCPCCVDFCDDNDCIGVDDDAEEFEEGDHSQCFYEGCVLPASDWHDRLQKAKEGKEVRSISACVDEDKLS